MFQNIYSKIRYVNHFATGLNTDKNHLKAKCILTLPESTSLSLFVTLSEWIHRLHFLVQYFCHRTQHLGMNTTTYRSILCILRENEKCWKPSHEEPNVEQANVLLLGHYGVWNPCWCFDICSSHIIRKHSVQSFREQWLAENICMMKGHSHKTRYCFFIVGHAAHIGVSLWLCSFVLQHEFHVFKAQSSTQLRGHFKLRKPNSSVRMQFII